MQAHGKARSFWSFILPARSYSHKSLKPEIEHSERERTTNMGLSVTNTTPKRGETITFTVTLWRFSVADITQQVSNAEIVVRRAEADELPTQTVVTTNANGQARWTEKYSDSTELTCHAEYIPPSGSLLKGSHSNTVKVTVTTPPQLVNWKSISEKVVWQK